jgi:hypothetical protein
MQAQPATPWVCANDRTKALKGRANAALAMIVYAKLRCEIVSRLRCPTSEFFEIAFLGRCPRLS